MQRRFSIYLKNDRDGIVSEPQFNNVCGLHVNESIIILSKVRISKVYKKCIYIIYLLSVNA